MQGIKLTIIGMSDKRPSFSQEIKEKIAKHRYFAGGKRHCQLVSDLLPQDAIWIDITVPLEKMMEAIREEAGEWLIFASGDPLFFGIANTLRKEFPKADIKIYPTFNSLQLLAHKFEIEYGKFPTVTLTGRPWHEFDKVLIQGQPRMGVLTDRNKTPRTIAQRMIKYNYSNYIMYYGERMGGEKEKTMKLSLQQALEMEVQHPNCIYLQKTDNKIPAKGISEKKFQTLEGRPNMITKMPFRIATLALMELHQKHMLWDIGACTGSVSIEAKLHHPHLKVHAFEIRRECKEIIENNTYKFQAPSIGLSIGDYLATDKGDIEKPDVVFIGGHGNKLEEMLKDVNVYLGNGATIAFNAVKEDNKNRFLAWCADHAYQIKHAHLLRLDEYNPMNILIAEKTD